MRLLMSLLSNAGNPSGCGKVTDPRGSLQMTSTPRYGEVANSDEVHEQIRDLASRAKNIIQENFQKHATSEKQVLQGIQCFGPSAQSQKMLRLENDAAKKALTTGVYVLWRCEKPKLSGANTDFCARIGGKHRCFCGHTLDEHEEPRQSRGRLVAPKCGSCVCPHYVYMPNEPEEIGEGWLTRRSGWNPSQWSAKCRCGHGHLRHDPQNRRCKDCYCGMFESHFLCVVCDCNGEAHETVFELEGDRIKRGLPVREEFFPLGNVEWSVREMVLSGPTCDRKQGQCTPRIGSSRGAISHNNSPQQGLLPSIRASAPTPVQPLPPHCGSCAAIFRSPQSKFCSNCGKARV